MNHFNMISYHCFYWFLNFKFNCECGIN